MLKGSAQKHITTTSHLSGVAAASEVLRQAALNNHRLQQPYYASSEAAIYPSTHLAAPAPRMGLFDAPADDDMPELIPLDDEPLDDNKGPYRSSPLIPVGILPISSDDPSAERELLRRQVEMLLMQAEQVDEFGGTIDENDSTLTNIVEQFRLLGKISDQSFSILAETIVSICHRSR